VRIERDLSGSGHLARGSHTNMSRINFSVRSRSRDYLDPELQALRPVVGAAPPDVAPPDTAAVVPVVDPSPAAPPTVLQRIAAVFRRGGA